MRSPVIKSRASALKGGWCQARREWRRAGACGVRAMLERDSNSVAALLRGSDEGLG